MFSLKSKLEMWQCVNDWHCLLVGLIVLSFWIILKKNYSIYCNNQYHETKMQKKPQKTFYLFCFMILNITVNGIIFFFDLKNIN